MVLECVGLSVKQLSRRSRLGESASHDSIRPDSSKNKRPLRWTYIQQAAPQMIQALQTIHDSGYVYKGTHQGNFLLSIPSDHAWGEWSKIYVIDFERAMPWRTGSGEHILWKTYDDSDPYYGGRVKLMSLNAHLRHELSRRDDLESLWFMLVDLARGGLPWDGKKCSAEVFVIKKDVSPEQLCEGLPEVLLSFIKHVRKLKFDDKPDYDYLLKLFS